MNKRSEIPSDPSNKNAVRQHVSAHQFDFHCRSNLISNKEMNSNLSSIIPIQQTFIMRNVRALSCWNCNDVPNILRMNFNHFSLINITCVEFVVRRIFIELSSFRKPISFCAMRVCIHEKAIDKSTCFLLRFKYAYCFRLHILLSANHHVRRQ